jgi:hypothetical protein
MPSQRILILIAVLAIGYVLGAKFPGIAGRLGLV